jgi:two-component system, NarL family, response regulator NreC
MPKIRCLLVDDHTLFRQGVRRLLETESDFEIIGESPDAGDAVEKARDLRPDIVLMDIGMPGLSSFEAARQIRKNRPETKVLFLTMYEDEDYLVQCLEVGAAGYVLKDTPAPQLVTAVRDVYKGGKYLSSQVLGKLVEDFRARVRDAKMRPRISTLTPREREILKLLADGLSNADVAEKLYISQETVKSHVRHILTKLEADTRTHAVAIALREAIID